MPLEKKEKYTPIQEQDTKKEKESDEIYIHIQTIIFSILKSRELINNK